MFKLVAVLCVVFAVNSLSTNGLNFVAPPTDELNQAFDADIASFKVGRSLVEYDRYVDGRKKTVSMSELGKGSGWVVTRTRQIKFVGLVQNMTRTDTIVIDKPRFDVYAKTSAIFHFNITLSMAGVDEVRKAVGQMDLQLKCQFGVGEDRVVTYLGARGISTKVTSMTIGRPSTTSRISPWFWYQLEDNWRNEHSSDSGSNSWMNSIESILSLNIRPQMTRMSELLARL